MLMNLNDTNMLFHYQVPPTIEEQSCDWFKCKWMLVNTVLNDIIENTCNKEFYIEYGQECEAKLWAKHRLHNQKNNSPYDARWMQKICMDTWKNLAQTNLAERNGFEHSVDV